MDVQQVRAALHERLGPEATADLVQVINVAGREWKDETMNAAGDRFERRLVEETSALRLQMAQMEARLLRWSFLFWIGQVAVMTGIMSALMRVR